MTETVYVRTESGVVMPMDVPAGEYIDGDDGVGEWSTHARQRFEDALRSGQLTKVDGDVESYVDEQTGAIRWRELHDSAGITDEVPTGSIASVLEWVGNDAGRAERALDVEADRPKPRPKLVADLEAILDAASDSAGITDDENDDDSVDDNDD